MNKFIYHKELFCNKYWVGEWGSNAVIKIIKIGKRLVSFWSCSVRVQTISPVFGMILPLGLIHEFRGIVPKIPRWTNNN